MKSYLVFIPLCLTGASLAGSVLLQSGFEASGDTWGYTLDPNVMENEKGDIWDAITGIGDSTELQAPDTGSLFWGGRDMDGTALGSSRAWIVFDSVDVSDYENVELSFAYNYESLSSGADQMGYLVGTSNDGSDVELSLDYTVGTDMSLVPGATVLFKVNSGGGYTSNGWSDVSIAIPDGTTNVALALYAFIDGGYNYVGFDSVSLSGEPGLAVIPEPRLLPLLLGGALMALIGLRRRR